MKWLKINTVLFIAVLSCWAPLSQADTQFRVIVDASGSMIISDPDKLTAEALRLISDLAPEEKTTLGIWLFGEAPRVLLPEGPINKANKAKLASYLNSYVTQDVKTDLEAIIALLLETPDSEDLAVGFERHWILVTDGMVDISLEDEVNRASRERILNDLSQQLEDRGIHLHTVSMTGYTDKDLLQTLSLKTNSTHTEVAIPEDLLDTFERIFSQVDPEERLPFKGNTFTVDKFIHELTLIVFHEPNEGPEIVTPSGSILPIATQDNISVALSDHYTLVTVKNPEVGDWQVNNVNLERSSVRVITDLSARVTKIPPIIFINESINSNVGVFQKGEIIGDQNILNMVSVKQTLIRLNGEHKEAIYSQDMEQVSNQFQHDIKQIAEPGNYELVSHLDGQTFSRELGQYFTVHPGIEFKGEQSSENLVAFSAKPSNLRLNVMRSKVTLELTDKDGTVNTEEMTLIGQGYWERVIPVSPDESMKVRAQLIGFTQAGVRFEYWTPMWDVTRSGIAAPLVMLTGSVVPSVVFNVQPSPSAGVAPVFVPPSVVVVESQDEESLVEEPPVINDIDLDETTESIAGLSTQEWILYGVLNVGGVLLLAIGVLLYRRMKNKKDLEG
ncbi:VWA domain-containing protein [Marinomonas transparens]|uniref:VWA domain-containing protein n=1 Tax=Marinomonas transparens TaxID=2795388 RepID=A0A934JPA4_9GAMM|nr:VWA domain-containing protein [Marinomonas transparens]MBJ7537614.1 VWA domain-containing protein [Marinomonas transparens]